MKRFFNPLAICLLLLCAVSADAGTIRKTTIVITVNPSDGNSLTVNGDTRTFKTTVGTPSAQSLIGASIAATLTNLYNQISSYRFSGPIDIQKSGTDTLILIGQVDGALTVSKSGSWGTLTDTTFSTDAGRVIRFPLALNPSGTRTADANQVIADIFNSGYASTAASASSSVLANYVAISGNQTIAGNKTFSGTLTISGNITGSGIYAATMTNGVFVLSPSSQGKLQFRDTSNLSKSTIESSSSGLPLLLDTATGLALATTPAPSNVVNRAMGDLVWPGLTTANSFTGTNQFQRITNSAIVNSTITGSTLSGTIGTVTSGTIDGATWTNGTHRGPLQVYKNSSSNLEVGNNAAVTSPFTGGVALGKDSLVGANDGVAIGNGASSAGYSSAVAIGAGSVVTDNGQIRMGTSSANYLCSPGNIRAGKNIAIGTETANFPGSLDKGIFFIAGTAPGADPSGAAVWNESGALKYRSNGSSEGAGQANFIHNRSSETQGSGSDFTVAGTSYARVDFGTTDPDVALPTAGTYLIIATVTYTPSAGTQTWSFKLYNSTDAADVSGSEVTRVSAAATRDCITNQKLVTVTGAKTIQLYGQNATAAAGQVHSGGTRLSYVRLQ